MSEHTPARPSANPRRGAGRVRPARAESWAWQAIIDRYRPLIHAVARGYRLNDCDTEDVGQTVWLRLVEYLDRLREPRALARWLVTHGQPREPPAGPQQPPDSCSSTRSTTPAQHLETAHPGDARRGPAAPRAGPSAAPRAGRRCRRPSAICSRCSPTINASATKRSARSSTSRWAASDPPAAAAWPACGQCRPCASTCSRGDDGGSGTLTRPDAAIGSRPRREHRLALTDTSASSGQCRDSTRGSRCARSSPCPAGCRSRAGSRR